MEFERNLLIEAMHDEDDEYDFEQALLLEIFPCARNNNIYFKDARVSDIERGQGNESYAQAKHDAKVHATIMHHYNKSMAYAPRDSENLVLFFQFSNCCNI